jgi:hypothetical protein
MFLLAAAAPAPVAGCPSTAAVAAELERLGTAAAVAAVGVPEVRVDGTGMRVALRGLDGKVSGEREIAAPAACSERAAVAAVLVSAWVGAWPSGSSPTGARPSEAKADRATSLAPPFPPVRSPATAIGTPANAPARAAHAPLLPPPAVTGVSSSAAAAPPAEAPTMTASGSRPNPTAARIGRPARQTLIELGGFGFGIHDGDAGAFGGGLQAGFRFPHWLGLDAVLAGTLERERAMVRGSAAYRLYSLSVGPNARTQVGPVAGDVAVLPELTFLSVDGRSLNPGLSVTRWGAGAAARLRLALVLGRFRPFALASTSYALRAERLRLDDYPGQSITLSRWNFTLGLGVSYCFGAVNPGETNSRHPALGPVE